MEDQQDGVIYMTIQDFKARFIQTMITYDNSDWSYAKFLKLDDDTEPNGTFPWCGATCVKHRLTVTSTTEQEVYISAHVWDKRIMPDSCETLTNEQEHSFRLNGASTV